MEFRWLFLCFKIEVKFEKNILLSKHIHSFIHSFKKPNVFKFVQLLSVHKTHDLCNLGKYVYFAFKSRECILS